MRNYYTNSIDKYIKACKNDNWIFDEAYKFEFANYVFQNVDWDNQTDEQILEILLQSQKNKYTSNSVGIQFIIKGAFDLKNVITIEDIILFRKIKEGAKIEDVNWDNRGMSFTVLSAWLSVLFPEKIYPVPLKGFNETINYLFDTENTKLPKTGIKYIINSQIYLKETEDLLAKYPLQELFLNKWNEFYSIRPELGINNKTEFSKVDKVWLVQDFHLFVLRNILGIVKTKKKNIKVAELIEPTAIEGASKLATHMRYERNSSFIKTIKKQALEENIMLNCSICGFSFLNTYGEIGEGFIEAHHINPLNEQEGEKVTKKTDIALICSNCHRMLHRKIDNKYLTVKELKEIITKHNNA